MGESSNTEFPYKSLGAWLRRMRLKRQQSLAEVSGAVEVEVTNLADMEKGVQRPSEDILMLLMSYFSVSESDAVQLWELAGYDAPENAMESQASSDSDHHDPQTMLQPVVILPVDSRIIYTDATKIDSNESGVTIHFMQQGLSVQGKPVAVSRVGMSREYAQKLLTNLQDALQTKPQKLLPGPEDSQKKQSDRDR